MKVTKLLVVSLNDILDGFKIDFINQVHETIGRKHTSGDCDYSLLELETLIRTLGLERIEDCETDEDIALFNKLIALKQKDMNYYISV